MPPERQLFASAAHLSDTHLKLISHASRLTSSHPSAVCRAVASDIQLCHLSAFQRRVLEVEETILKDDPALVGAYGIVPLTAIMCEFQQWTRRIDWFWETTRFILAEDNNLATRQGADLIDRLRIDVQSGYGDVAETALSLLSAAETAWLQQVSAWILYGRLLSFGTADFFVQVTPGPQEDYTCVPDRLPAFVTPKTASSMLYIGKSLNRIRAAGSLSGSLGGLDHASSKIEELASLTCPLNGASFARTVRSIRLSLAEKTLSKLLPLDQVVDIVQLLRDFFLLGRGEFALALAHEADETMRNRWRRAGHVAYERHDSLKNLAVKEGEFASVVSRTWAVLTCMQGHHGEEDEQLDRARELLRLYLRPPSPLGDEPELGIGAAPFRNLLFSVPSTLLLELPSPLDMDISSTDLELYSDMNAYLLSLRRAHVRLTGLWKLTSLRRHHAAPRGAGEQAVVLRKRWSARWSVMRNLWTTASAAIFFLGETEAYLQTEVVGGMWDSFSTWLAGNHASRHDRPNGPDDADGDGSRHDKASQDRQRRPVPDAQILSAAHSLYLGCLAQRLLLTQARFTESLYRLLTHIDGLVSFMRRLHSIFTSVDLEIDAGVVDASLDLGTEEEEVMGLLRAVEGKVRRGIEDVVNQLHGLENDAEFLAAWEDKGAPAGEDELVEGPGYIAGKIGGIDRLLMKLDFGSWLESRQDGWGRNT